MVIAVRCCYCVLYLPHAASTMRAYIRDIVVRCVRALVLVTVGAACHYSRAGVAFACLVVLSCAACVVARKRRIGIVQAWTEVYVEARSAVGSFLDATVAGISTELLWAYVAMVNGVAMRGN